VIKSCGFAPILSDVAATTIGTEVPLVRILFAVASAAGNRRIAELRICGVTRNAGKTDMAASERELR